MPKEDGTVVAWIARNWLWLLIASLILLIAPLFTPGAFFFWSYGSFKELFHGSVGLGDAWSSIVAIIFTFFYVLAVPGALWWLVLGQTRGQPWYVILVLIVFVLGSKPLVHIFDAPFNQITGESPKCYDRRPNGEFVLFDNPSKDCGIDPRTGVARQRLTSTIAMLIERQKQGIVPRPITGDPRKVTFFDQVTGLPKVWYCEPTNGKYELFDAEGFCSNSPNPLRSITVDVVNALRQQADAVDAQARATEKEKVDLAAAEATREAARVKTEAKAQALQKLAGIFGAESYVAGTVIVGVRPRQSSDDLAVEAARQVQMRVIAAVRAKNLKTDSLRQSVYDSGYFDPLMNAQPELIADSGLAKKMRSAVLAIVDASCQPAQSVSGASTCTISTKIHVVKPSGKITLADEWSEKGPGVNYRDAIARASELLLERHSAFLNGI